MSDIHVQINILNTVIETNIFLFSHDDPYLQLPPLKTICHHIIVVLYLYSIVKELICGFVHIINI